jgi:hypothetical protein
MAGLGSSIAPLCTAVLGQHLPDTPSASVEQTLCRPFITLTVNDNENLKIRPWSPGGP